MGLFYLFYNTTALNEVFNAAADVRELGLAL
jgi:hypothetical protein